MAAQEAGSELISCEIKISPYELRVGVNFSGLTIRSAVLRLWKYAKGHLRITSNRRDLYYDIFFFRFAASEFTDKRRYYRDANV